MSPGETEDAAFPQHQYSSVINATLRTRFMQTTHNPYDINIVVKLGVDGQLDHEVPGVVLHEDTLQVLYDCQT